MITNEAEHRLTLAAIRQLQSAVISAPEAPGENGEENDLITSGIRAKLRELREQVAEYEALRDGPKTEFEADFNDLGDALRLLRHLAKMSQTELAEKLGVKQQQVQRYEALGYEQASLGRLKEVVWALGSPARCKFVVPGSHAGEQSWQEWHMSPPDWNTARPRLSVQQGSVIFGSLASSTANATYRVTAPNDKRPAVRPAEAVGTR